MHLTITGLKNESKKTGPGCLRGKTGKIALKGPPHGFLAGSGYNPEPDISFGSHESFGFNLQD